MPVFQDLTGQRFGRLTVVALESRGRGGVKWRVRCDCSEERTVPASSLRTGNTKSCGCLGRDATRQRNLKHGHAQRRKILPEYKVWLGMNERCTNPKHKDFASYGGRGIAVCERWRTFENFLADMGRRPSPKHSIDRVDVNGHYGPDNCRWATPAEQGRNRRDNRMVTFNGETLCLTDWAARVGTSASVIADRLDEGWTAEQALTTAKSDPHAAKDMTGLRFGRLLVLRREGSAGLAATWVVRCDCGMEVVVRGISMRSGQTKSCGCLRRERARETNSKAGREARKAARQCV